LDRLSYIYFLCLLGCAEIDRSKRRTLSHTYMSSSSSAKSLGKKLIKYSGIQRTILALYAQFVRLSRERPGLLDKVRQEFREGAKLNSRNDSLLIDYKLRRAKNQLAMLKAQNVKSVKVIRIGDTSYAVEADKNKKIN
jgi:hypothetical protein